MTIRRRRLWLVALAGLVLAGGVWVWAISQATSIRDAARIEIGMTQNDVFATLGSKPSALHCNNGTRGWIDVWVVFDGHILVQYGSDSKVNFVGTNSEGFFYRQWSRLRSVVGI
jgi:hypothetical protein